MDKSPQENNKFSLIESEYESDFNRIFKVLDKTEKELRSRRDAKTLANPEARDVYDEVSEELISTFYVMDEIRSKSDKKERSSLFQTPLKRGDKTTEETSAPTKGGGGAQQEGELTITKQLETQVKELEVQNEHLKHILKEAALQQQEMNAELKELRHLKQQRFSILTPPPQQLNGLTLKGSNTENNINAQRKNDENPLKSRNQIEIPITVNGVNTQIDLSNNGLPSTERVNLEQFLEPVKTQDDIELEKYQKEFEVNKKELDNILEQKLLLEDISSAGTKQHLRSVLYKLEATRRKIQGTNIDTDDRDLSIDFDDITGRLLHKFDKSQRRTVKKAIRQQLDSNRKSSEDSRSLMLNTIKRTAEVATEPDPVVWKGFVDSVQKDLIEAVENRERDFMSVKSEMNSLYEAYEDQRDNVDRLKSDLLSEREAKRQNQEMYFKAKKEVEKLQETLELAKREVQRLQTQSPGKEKKKMSFQQSASNVNLPTQEEVAQLNKEIIKWKRKYMQLKYQIIHGEKAPEGLWDEDLLSELSLTRTASLSKMHSRLSSKRSHLPDEGTLSRKTSQPEFKVDDELKYEEEVVRVKKTKVVKQLKVEEYSDPEDEVREMQVRNLEKQIKAKKKEVEERKKKLFEKKKTMESELQGLKQQASNLEFDEYSDSNNSPTRSPYRKHSRTSSKQYEIEDPRKNFVEQPNEEDDGLQETLSPPKISKNRSNQQSSSSKYYEEDQLGLEIERKDDPSYQIDQEFNIDNESPGVKKPKPTNKKVQSLKPNNRKSNQSTGSVASSTKPRKKSSPIREQPKSPNKSGSQSPSPRTKQNSVTSNTNNATNSTSNPKQSAKSNASPASKNIDQSKSNQKSSKNSNNSQAQQQPSTNSTTSKSVPPVKVSTRSIGVQVKLDWEGLSQQSPSERASGTTHLRTYETEEEISQRIKTKNALISGRSNNDNKQVKKQLLFHKAPEQRLHTDEDETHLLRIRENTNEDNPFESISSRYPRTTNNKSLEGNTNIKPTPPSSQQSQQLAKKKAFKHNNPDRLQENPSIELEIEIDEPVGRLPNQKSQQILPKHQFNNTVYTPQTKSSKQLHTATNGSNLNANKHPESKKGSYSESKALSLKHQMNQTTSSLKQHIKLGSRIQSNDSKHNLDRKVAPKFNSYNNLEEPSDDEDLRQYNHGEIQTKVSPHFKVKLNEIIEHEDTERNYYQEQKKEEPAPKKMYRAMLNTALKDPKVINIFKRYHVKTGGEVDKNGEFIPDYRTFHKFVDDFIEKHKKCGVDCIHLQRFYSRIGFYPVYNNRKTLEMNKKDVTNMPNKERHRYKLPLIPRQKKFAISDTEVN